MHLQTQQKKEGLSLFDSLLAKGHEAKESSENKDTSTQTKDKKKS